MLSSSDLEQLLKEEVIEFLRSTKDFCIDNNPEVLDMVPQVNALTTIVSRLDKALLYERESKYTKILENLDMERDAAVIGIKYGFLMNLHHEDPTRRAAGQLLLDHLDSYGDRITKLNYESESTILINLVDDYKNKESLKKALAIVELTSWAIRIKTSNKAFRAKYKERISIESADGKVSYTAIKPEAIETYDKFIKRLEAHIELDEIEKYTQINNQLKTLGDRYLQILKIRRSNNDNDNDPADTNDDID